VVRRSAARRGRKRFRRGAVEIRLRSTKLEERHKNPGRAASKEEFLLGEGGPKEGAPYPLPKKVCRRGRGRRDIAHDYNGDRSGKEVGV